MDLIKIFSGRLWIVTDLLRYLFLWLDGIIYGSISPLFQSTMKLTSIRQFLANDTFNIVDFVADRVYVFLALFMFFKLAFSVITMIANPDAISDKQKGLSKIFTNSIITIILVVGMPIIFQIAYSAQDIIINRGVLSNIFMGPNEGENAVTMDSGQKIAKSVFKIFIGKNPNVKSIHKDVESVINEYNEEKNGVGVDLFFQKNVITNHEGDSYRLYYIMLVSTVVGVMLMISFVKMAVEVALRSIKLLLMEVISPIAIISFVDPQSSSKGVFSKWVAITMKTYLALFIRLSILFFSTALLSSIDFESFGRLENNQLGIFEMIFVILAFVAFMQTAPKLLEDLFGYKPDEDSKAVKGIVGGALGFGAGATAGLISGARAGAASENGVLRKAWGGFKGAAGGTIKGGKTGFKTGTKSAKDGSAGIMSTYGSGKAALDELHKSDKYKALEHAKGLRTSREEQKEYEKAKPKWADLNNDALEEQNFSNANKGNAALMNAYNSIQGPNAKKLKEEFRKKEAQKVANNATYSSQYAKAKNDLLDKGFEKKLAAAKVGAMEINAQKASRLVDKQSSSRQLQNQISAQDALIKDTSGKITAEEKQKASIQKSYYESDLANVNAEISGLSNELTASGLSLADVQSGNAFNAASNLVVELRAEYDTISTKNDKMTADFKTIQEEPRYSRDVKKDKEISRGKINQ